MSILSHVRFQQSELEDMAPACLEQRPLPYQYPPPLPAQLANSMSTSYNSCEQSIKFDFIVPYEARAFYLYIYLEPCLVRYQAHSLRRSRPQCSISPSNNKPHPISVVLFETRTIESNIHFEYIPISATCR
jgi:hypothetical protein